MISVLFLAVCAYAGAKLWSSLDPELNTMTVRTVTLTDSAALEGIAVRREQSFCPAGAFSPADGSRIPAGSLSGVSCSALYYSSCDGFESLSPEALADLDVSALTGILSARPAQADGGRLVLDFDWYYAALVSADAPIPDHGRCRILFEGFDVPVEGYILSLSQAESGQKALVLRLTQGGDPYMSMRKCSAQMIFSEYTGLSLPVSAVRRDEDGNSFVYTITAGIVECKAVDIIYTDGDDCLAALSTAADALREGNTVIVSGKEIYEGKVIA